MDLKNNIQRIENMLYSICGCNSKDAKKVLEECLKRNKKRRIRNEKTNSINNRY